MPNPVNMTEASYTAHVRQILKQKYDIDLDASGLVNEVKEAHSKGISPQDFAAAYRHKQEVYSS